MISNIICKELDAIEEKKKKLICTTNKDNNYKLKRFIYFIFYILEHLLCITWETTKNLRNKKIQH